MAISKEFLSASTDGVPVKVAAIVTPGTLLHTAHATAKDELFLYLMNHHTADLEATIEYGGQVDPDNLIKITIPKDDGLHLVIPGTILTNNNTVRAFASIANVFIAIGWINRHT